MSFLQNKRILITGVLSNRSIAYGVAKACHAQGAQLAFTYQNERFEERIRELAQAFDSAICLPCDVSEDSQIDGLAEMLSGHWSQLDGLVHAIAFAPREAIAGDFLEGLSREGFRISHDISSYSLPALAKAFKPLMTDHESSIVALTYHGASKVVPAYNTMGLAKASLEAAVRYTAASLGPLGIRVNGVSAGPIKTLAASGIKGFGQILSMVEKQAPLRRNVTIEDVGNVCAFMLSDLARGMTGEITYVDSGFNIMAAIGPEA